MLFLAIVGAGSIFAGTNPAYTQYELNHHFQKARVSCVITDPELLDSVMISMRSSGVPQNRVLIFDTSSQPVPKGFDSWKTLLEHGETDWIRFDDKERSRMTPAARLFSSGTTGLPKPASISHSNLISQHTLAHELHQPDYEVSRSTAWPELFTDVLCFPDRTNGIHADVPCSYGAFRPYIHLQERDCHLCDA